MKLKSVKEANVANKRVLLLVDYDVPINQNGHIADDSRIRLTIPTIEYLRSQNAKIIILCKRGRPDGKIIAALRTDVLAQHLEKLLNRQVLKINSTIGKIAEDAARSLQPKQILMLENSRFLIGEGTNDTQTARDLSKLADVVVNDQFSIAHRAEASRSAIAKFLPVYAGLGLLLEVKMLSLLTTNPKRPFVAIIGGAKISDKLPAIENLSRIADVVLVGGGVANNFLKATGVDVAKSYLQDKAVDKAKRTINYVKLAHDLLADNPKKHLLDGFLPINKIQYPLDVIAADDPAKYSLKCTLNVVNPEESDCPDDDLMFLDIGPATIRLYTEIIKKAKTVFWNGPMGVFEQNSFSAGTKAIAEAISHSQAVSILGGGDTIAAINKFKLAKKFDYVSAAGGAALEFLSGKTLPGLAPMVVK